MSAAATIVAIIGAVAALILAARSLQSHRLTFEKKALMVALWALLIISLAFVLGRIGV